MVRQRQEQAKYHDQERDDGADQEGNEKEPGQQVERGEARIEVDRTRFCE